MKQNYVETGIWRRRYYALRETIKRAFNWPYLKYRWLWHHAANHDIITPAPLNLDVFSKGFSANSQ